jgi:hypothetical protein
MINMPREDYSDFIQQHGGPSDEDFQTVSDTVNAGKGLYGATIGRFKKGAAKRKNTKSIIGMAARNTFDFPVFISKSVPLDYATATTQLLEQVYAAYVQMAVTQQPYVDAESVKCGGLLSQFQTNVNKYVEYMYITDTEYQHQAVHNQIFTEDYEFTFDLLDCDDETGEEILQEMEYTPLSEFDDFFQEGGGARGGGRPTIGNVDAEGRRVVYGPNGRDIIARAHVPEQEQRNREEYYNRAHTKLQAEKDAVDLDMAKKQQKDYKRHERENTENIRVKTMNKNAEVLKEDDMRKMNSMKPLLMKVQMRVTRPGQPDDPREFTIGIHCHVRLIEPELLPEVVKYPLKEMNEISRRAKWKAGELKFMRDIVFQIKEKKQTAIDSRDPKKRWYRRLYQLAHEKGDANVAGEVSGNATTGLIPNATIMITNGDVENIKAQTKLDVMKPGLVKRLCNELFLMSFIVIDQDAESIKLYIPDLYKDWDVHSIASVEKQLAEMSTAGSKTRDLFKLIK